MNKNKPTGNWQRDTMTTWHYGSQSPPQGVTGEVDQNTLKKMFTFEASVPVQMKKLKRLQNLENA